VTCATYNFETTSKMWTVLSRLAKNTGTSSSPSTSTATRRMPRSRGNCRVPPSTVRVTCRWQAHVVSHAKFIVVDHTVLLLTSANFSFSAENRTSSSACWIHDPALAASVEETMETKQHTLYELVA
jgi:phosphatidylserine/phosphatidylglycerophosphate/cardiolipin synthase-like enzyme